MYLPIDYLGQIAYTQRAVAFADRSHFYRAVCSLTRRPFGKDCTETEWGRSMQLVVEVKAPDANAQIDYHPHKNISASTAEVDFTIFGAAEIRDVLKSKAHCLRAGFSANHFIIKTLNEIRDNYIQRVGLPTYLSQMLGPVGTVPIEFCTLYNEHGGKIGLHLNGNCQQPLQRFIAKHFEWNKLPAVVEIQSNSPKNKIEIRYL